VEGEQGQASTGSKRAETAAGDACPFCGAADGEAVRIRPGKHRALQAARTGGRKLFDGPRKESFLQWFALTANVSFAASQAGVCRQTVSKHRLSCPEFEEAYRRAVELAVPDLQARLFAYLNGRPKLDLHGELEPPDEDKFDPQLAIQILREQQRMMRGSVAGGPLKPGRTPRVASNEEVRAALTKRLAAFGDRIAAGRYAERQAK
jgi:hypothetical protein